MAATLCGRPLKFGDVEQIKAMRKLRAEAEANMAEEAARGQLSVWTVCYSFRRERTAIVVATSREEAEELVEDQVYGEGDVEIEETMFERVADPKEMARGPHVETWG